MDYEQLQDQALDEYISETEQWHTITEQMGEEE